MSTDHKSAGLKIQAPARAARRQRRGAMSLTDRATRVTAHTRPARSRTRQRGPRVAMSARGPTPDNRNEPGERLVLSWPRQRRAGFVAAEDSMSARE